MHIVSAVDNIVGEGMSIIEHIGLPIRFGTKNNPQLLVMSRIEFRDSQLLTHAVDEFQQIIGCIGGRNGKPGTVIIDGCIGTDRHFMNGYIHGVVCIRCGIGEFNRQRSRGGGCRGCPVGIAPAAAAGAEKKYEKK